jgi:small-conductance mechanosensitive channel
MTFDPTVIVDTIVSMVNSFLAQLPKIALAIVVLIAFYFLARLVENLVRRFTGRISPLGSIAIARIAMWVVIIVGVLVAMAIVFPSVNVATLVSALGIGGVAFGFAFRDVLENFFGGLVLLLTEPFKIGDQIIVGEYEGTIQKIETRATTIHTYDNRDVIIPNAKLMTEYVIVNTAHDVRRSEFDIGISYASDIGRAKQLIVEAMHECEVVGLLAEPAPDAVVVALAEYTINIRARWWTNSTRRSVIDINDRVLTAIFEKLSSNGVDIAFPTYKVLFQEQPEKQNGEPRAEWAVPGHAARRTIHRSS